MLRFAPYVLKSLWRHRTRTLLTVSGSAVALFVFCFIGAVQEGLDRLRHDQAAQRTLIVFQANRYCPFTSRLPEHYGPAIAQMEGVADVIPVKVFMNNCRASLDLIVFHGVPPSKLRQFRELELLEGDWRGFEQRRDAGVVGRAVAQRRNLKVGDRFSVGAVTLTVAGIFASPRPAEENFVYTELEFLQRIPGLRSVGEVTQFEVKLKEGADADAVCRAIDERYRGGPIQTDTRTRGVFEANAVGDLVELIGLAHYLGYACVALVLALVATTTMMAVQDRVREHAVLQTLGFSSPLIFALVLAESVLVSLIGGLLGVGLASGVLAVGGIALGTEGVVISFEPSPAVSAGGLAVSLAVGLLAGLVPAWQAARAEIVASLRSV
jgi:putative ABC transport system permease protein